jgi:MinD-like ATPase involved in chromosome partitioning or flagellar assembly
LAEDRQDRATGAEPVRLSDLGYGRRYRPADGGRPAAAEADDAEYWRRGGLGGLFGSSADDYAEEISSQQVAYAGPDAAGAAREAGYGEPGPDDVDGPASGDPVPDHPVPDQPVPDQPGRDDGLPDDTLPDVGPAIAGGAAGGGTAGGGGLGADGAAAAAGVAQQPPRRRHRTVVAAAAGDSIGAAGRRAHARNGTRELAREVAPTASQAAAGALDGLTPSLLLPARRRAPSPGWRRTVYQASGGRVRIPTSSSEARRRDMIGRARTPVAAGHYRVAVLSLKGGVGKTTTTVGLGSTLASLRGDRVIAIDANPDRGTLSDKLTPQTAATVRDLLDERDQIRRYADVRGFTSQTPSRLEVLASAQDPAVSVAFSEEDYCRACSVLERYYSICITDCGTGLMHSAMTGVLRLADQIVLVSTASVDGARSASACMDWLAAHGHHDLVRNGVVVLTGIRKRASRAAVDLDLLEGHFAARCRAVTRVPYDPYLAQGADVELDQMRRTTASAFLELAAVVGDGFSRRRAEPRAIGPSAG